MADSGAPGPSRGRGRGRLPSKPSQSAPRPGGMNVPATTTRESISTAPPSTAASASQGSSGGMSSLTSQPVSQAASDNISFEKRHGFGTAGRTIALRTNNFFVECRGNPTFYTAKVDIVVDGFGKKLNKDSCFFIFWEFAKELKLIKAPYSLIYDGGTTAYSLHPFPGQIRWGPTEIPHVKFGRPQKYMFNLNPGPQHVFDFKDEDHREASLGLLDVVYRQFYNTDESGDSKSKNFFPFGRNFFYNPRQGGTRTSFDLDAGRQVWSGYFMTAKVGVGSRPIMNIDVANSAFLKDQPVLAFMCDVLNQATGRQNYRMEELEKMTTPYTLKPNEIQMFTRAIRGYTVEAITAPGRAQTVFAVSTQSADQIIFEHRDANGDTNKYTVSEYFAKRRNINLRYPFFPCLQLGSKKRFASLPLEVCRIFFPQRVKGKLTDTQTAAMIKGVCTDAPTRENRIVSVIRDARFNNDPFAKEFGLDINLKPIELTGRVIAPPALEYMGGQKITPRDGSWNLGSAKLYHPARLTCYGVISFIGPQSSDDMKSFCQMLTTTARTMGMSVNEMMPTSVKFVKDIDSVRGEMLNCLSECGNQGKTCDLILVFAYARNTEIYSAVKNIAEREIGVPTQVVLQRNVRGAKPQTCSNIVLKINAKLGGINWALAADRGLISAMVYDKDTMVVGLDVTHPGPTDQKTPSIAAAVSNSDKLPGKFGASITLQKHRRESVVYIIDAFEKRLQAYYNVNKAMPSRIIIYRDGVAEGQFNEIMKEELKGIRLAWLKWGKEKCERPNITFVVVQKRHHTRFFCANKGDQCGRAANTPPGTIIDTVITKPELYDFFLCSHFGIQGTSRPAHYHVLMDENKFKEDELQALTYYYCHLYARCTRSVSIPAPTYYAHLACARARLHLHDIIGDGSVDSQSVKEGSVQPRVTKDANKEGPTLMKVENIVRAVKDISIQGVKDGSDESSDLLSQQATEDVMKQCVQVVDKLAETMYFC